MILDNMVVVNTVLGITGLLSQKLRWYTKEGAVVRGPRVLTLYPHLLVFESFLSLLVWRISLLLWGSKMACLNVRILLLSKRYPNT